MSRRLDSSSVPVPAPPSKACVPPTLCRHRVSGGAIRPASPPRPHSPLRTQTSPPHRLLATPHANSPPPCTASRQGSDVRTLWHDLARSNNVWHHPALCSSLPSRRLARPRAAPAALFHLRVSASPCLRVCPPGLFTGLDRGSSGTKWSQMEPNEAKKNSFSLAAPAPRPGPASPRGLAGVFGKCPSAADGNFREHLRPHSGSRAPLRRSRRRRFQAVGEGAGISPGTCVRRGGARSCRGVRCRTAEAAHASGPRPVPRSQRSGTVRWAGGNCPRLESLATCSALGRRAVRRSPCRSSAGA